jgi:hypothetical protein
LPQFNKVNNPHLSISNTFYQHQFSGRLSIDRGFIHRLSGGLARRFYGGVADWHGFFGEEVIVARIKI